MLKTPSEQRLRLSLGLSHGGLFQPSGAVLFCVLKIINFASSLLLNYNVVINKTCL